MAGPYSRQLERTAIDWAGGFWLRHDRHDNGKPCSMAMRRQNAISRQFLTPVNTGVGDIVGMLFSLYVLYEAILLKIPFLLLVRMVWNIAVDFIVGLIPVLGDVFDVVWKANRKNVRLIEKYLRSHPTA